MTDVDRSKFLGITFGFAIPPSRSRPKALHFDFDLRMTRFDLVVGGLVAVGVLWFTTRLVEASHAAEVAEAVESPRPLRQIEAEIAAAE
jgi:hypothetical protein